LRRFAASVSVDLRVSWLAGLLERAGPLKICLFAARATSFLTHYYTPVRIPSKSTRSFAGPLSSPLTSAPRIHLRHFSHASPPSFGNMSSSQCLRRMAVSGAVQRPASLLAQSSKSARSLMRTPAATRSLSYAAKPSWSSYQALQSQYVWRHVKNSRKDEL
jgi:hypothetical protein